MMKDVNDCEKYLFLVSDENWLRFCEFFNECVMEYGTVDEELHYFRLKLNRAPETLELSTGLTRYITRWRKRLSRLP